jgi:group I intron endonuclease
MINSGIYEIKNKVTGMLYIGRTIDFNARKRRHISDLRSNIHKNPRLQHSWSARKETDFEFKLVWPESIENLEKLESFILEELFDTGKLYNAHKNSIGGWLGYKHTKENIEKFRKLHQGKTISNDAKEKCKLTRLSSSKWKAHQQTLSEWNLQKVMCEHCGKESNKGNYNRWHGSNCKFKE